MKLARFPTRLIKLSPLVRFHRKRLTIDQILPCELERFPIRRWPGSAGLDGSESDPIVTLLFFFLAASDVEFTAPRKRPDLFAFHDEGTSFA